MKLYNHHHYCFQNFFFVIQDTLPVSTNELSSYPLALKTSALLSICVDLAFLGMSQK